MTERVTVPLTDIPYAGPPYPPDTHVWVLNKAICCGEGCRGAACESPGCPCCRGDEKSMDSEWLP